MAVFSCSCFSRPVSLRMRCGPLCYTPSSSLSVSAQLPTTVTHLEIHGNDTVTTSSANSLIETFYNIDTISTYGSAVGVILCALCRTGSMPGDEKASLPRSIQVLHIHDDLGDGEDLYDSLYKIFNDTESIKIFFAPTSCQRQGESLRM